MKNRFMVLLAAIQILLIFTACGTPPLDRQLVKEVSALETYHNYINSMSSGKVVKYNYSFDSWFDIISTTKQSIHFAPGEDALLRMTVRERYPAVFWDFPHPTYFDGKSYYYRYNSYWYEDSNGRFQNRMEQNFLGFTGQLVENYDIIADNVYSRPDGGYDLYIQTGDEDSGVHHIISCKTDKDYNIENILVKTYTPKDARKNDYKISSSYIKYSKINSDFEVNPPSSFDSEAVFRGAHTTV